MRSGFSLIEMLVVVAILALLSGVVFGLEQSIFRQNTSLQASLLADQDARFALHRLVAEARAAAPADNGAYPLATVASTTFSFYADADGDSLHERIRYFLTGSTLWRGVVKPTGSPAVYNDASEVVTPAVHNLASVSPTMFRYYDSSYAGTTTPLAFPVTATDVRLIDVTLTIDNAPGRIPPASYTTDITLRNLKDNL